MINFGTDCKNILLTVCMKFKQIIFSFYTTVIKIINRALKRKGKIIERIKLSGRDEKIK